MSTRKEVSAPLDIRYEINSQTLEKAIDNLRKLGDQHGFDKIVDIDASEYYGSIEISVCLRLTRPETNAELEKRLAEEAHYIKIREQQERAELARLTKKYPKGEQ